MKNSLRMLFAIIVISTGCGRPAAPAGPAVATATTVDDEAASDSPKPVNVVYPELARFDAAPRRIDLRIQHDAIWGATGRNHANTIFLGVSAETGGEAELLALNPDTLAVTSLGKPVDELRRLNIACAGQNKIHTKIIQAFDGKLYFASMDETGENEDGSKPQNEHSHLWRLDPNGRNWQHLGSPREAVIAVAAGGRYIYFLAYFGHVLIQFDTIENRIINTIRVGSVGGHTTRYFIADDAGHVYVPRVSAEKAELVEFDDELREVKAFPLESYSRTPDVSSHGIIATAPLKDGSWLFTTDRGRLYHLIPRNTGGTVTDLGFVHPKGESYASCLFCLDGVSQVLAVTNVVPRGEPKYEVIRFDLKTRDRVATELKLPDAGSSLLLYGSFTRDDRGRCYLAGQTTIGGMRQPVCWCLEPFDR